MIKVKDKSLWGDSGSSFRTHVVLDIGYVVGVASMIITFSALVLALLLSERLPHARGSGPSHAAAELLVRLESHKRACFRFFDNMRPIMGAISAAINHRSFNLRESDALREAMNKERDALRQRFPEARLRVLNNKIYTIDPALSRRVAQKVELLRMIEDSALAVLGSESENILLRAVRAKSSAQKILAGSELASLIDRQQTFYLKMADDELGELEKELIPVVEGAY